MELTETPECPVCLQSYDGEYTIPRVLACGHTACEDCLSKLPQKFPEAIRCPACTVLVKLPAQGPSALPKNIDLLRFISTSSDQNPRKPADKPLIDAHVPFVPRAWSDEFFSTWKDYVLPQGAVEKEKVSLFSVESLSLVGDSAFKVGYMVSIMDCLSGLKQEKREELSLVLRLCNKQSARLCRVLGLWGDMVDGVLYLVCERQKNAGFLDESSDFGEDGLFSFAMIAMEICEAVIVLHKEGLIAGCLGFSCFQFDEFGHLHLDLNELLLIGRAARKVVLQLVSSRKNIPDEEVDVVLRDLSKRDVFVSPEVLFELVKKEGILLECGNLSYSVSYSSDVWLSGCILLRLVVGEQFSDELVDYMKRFMSKRSEENGFDFLGIYTSLMEKVSCLLKTKFGSDYSLLQQILCKCLDFDPENRPLLGDVWKSIRELVIKLKFDKAVKGEGMAYANGDQCLVFGELCRFCTEKTIILEKNESKRVESESIADNGDDKVQKKLFDGITEGNIKVKDLSGHLDCVTGLAVGGGFLFSSSFDKTVKVWSLQDYSNVHTFKGHEHKVMAMVYVDEEQPLCISGDSEGSIFIWSLSTPLGQEPLKKWNEQKDWRYSGIHALAVSGNGILYSGSGDKTIKAWSIKDGTLFSILSGHKSVVSTLALCNGVLYSGSWDGTIRLWSLTDHSLLIVLGEDMPGAASSVLSLAADQHTLVTAHENGSIKIWWNDRYMKSLKIHNGAIFTIGIDGKWLFTGSWDKTVHVQELAGDEFQVDARPIGSIPCVSVITALLYWQGMLFVGFSDRTVKVYFYGK